MIHVLISIISYQPCSYKKSFTNTIGASYSPAWIYPDIICPPTEENMNIVERRLISDDRYQLPIFIDVMS